MKTTRQQMSRILCALMALVCMFSMFSCGIFGNDEGEDKSGVAAISEIINNAKPTRVITHVSYTLDGETLKGRYTTQYDRANNKGKFDFSYERRAVPGESMSLGSIETIEGTVYSNNGEFSYDECATWQGGGVGYLEYSLDITESKLATYEVSEDGNSLTATVAKENAKRVFGVDISSEGDINLSVVTSGADLYNVTISYTTTTGASVVIETSYESLIINLDF